jgi:hypothetical protein
MHIELLSYSATAPGAAGAAAAAIGTDSLTVKNGKGAKMIGAWATNQLAGFHQISFPSGHDTTRGYRCDVLTGSSPAVFPLPMQMDVQAQELLSVMVAGSAVAGDVEQGAILMHYDDLPGISQRLITPAQLQSRAELLTTIQQQVASAAGPSYGTPALITAGSDLLRANRDYAVLGFTVRTNVHSVYFIGPDTSNLRVGCPGIANRPDVMAQFYIVMSNLTGRPCIPVINSGNKSSTFLGVVTDENAGNFNVTMQLALLK